MQFLITGATGFVGRELCARLARDGHRLAALVRSVERARGRLPATVELVELPLADVPNGPLEHALEGCDGLAHLAGDPIFGGRWTPEKKRALAESRVGLAQRLATVLGKVAGKPRAFVSASAVGYYGDRGDQVLREESPPGQDFLAQLCVDWERAAHAATAHGARVVSLRTGIVLEQGGGALAAMHLPFKLGLGGRLGSGKQYVSWIHRADLVELYARALVDPALSGAFNATAPEPATNAELARALAAALSRPAVLPAPAFALRAVLGEAATVLLSSQRAVPARFQAAGFRFAHPELAPALRAIFAPRRAG